MQKLYGIRCDQPEHFAREPGEWGWCCINGEPALYYSLAEAQVAAEKWAEVLARHGYKYQAALYGHEKAKPA